MEADYPEDELNEWYEDQLGPPNKSSEAGTNVQNAAVAGNSAQLFDISQEPHSSTLRTAAPNFQPQGSAGGPASGDGGTSEEVNPNSAGMPRATVPGAGGDAVHADPNAPKEAAVIKIDPINSAAQWRKWWLETC